MKANIIRISKLYSFLANEAKLLDDTVYKLRIDKGIGIMGTDGWEVHEFVAFDGYRTARITLQEESVEDVEECLLELLAVSRAYLVQPPGSKGRFFPKVVVLNGSKAAVIQRIRRVLCRDVTSAGTLR